MAELRVYRRHEVPPLIAAQVRSFVRVQWPFVHAGSTTLWDFEVREDAPLHFVIVEGEALVSHGHVRRRTVEHRGRAWAVDAVSSVFTYPDFRKAGHGARLVRAISDHVRTAGADLGMLFAGERVRRLYEGSGWRWIDAARVQYGDRTRPQTHTGSQLMTLAVTGAGAAAADVCAAEPVYVGLDTW
jgi:GNAT superfamily N-acetyltransferase